MIEPFLKQQLEPVAARRRQWRLQWHLALCWAIAAAVGFILIGLLRLSGASAPFLLPLLVAATGVASLVVSRRAQAWQPDFRQIARQIEEHHPELHALLLTAVEQQPEAGTGEFNYLQQRVIQEAVRESEQHHWIETVPRHQLHRLQWVQFVALVALLCACWGLRPVSRISSAAVLAKEQTISVTPGDASIERGSALVVLARFEGPLPPDAQLAISESSGQARRIPLVKNLDDPVFGGTVPELTADLTYRVEYAGKQTREFKVTVFEHPRLERADAKIHYPDYTRLAEKEVKDTHRVSAVEGSKLALDLQLNKPVASATLIGKDKSLVPLLVVTNKPLVTLTNFGIEASQTYELQLVDAEGRTNKVPAQFVLEALKNRRPELKLASPRGDQRVSPLEELTFSGEVWDDFGIPSYGLAYTVAGKETKVLELGQNAAGNEKRSFNHVLKLEELAVQPDQLISYYIWADDIGPDGKVRRTSSDMYFAEVRPLEEIFREGQSQEGQQQQGQQPGGGAGNESSKLAELQKQIISATWKLQREASDVKKVAAPPAAPAPAPTDTAASAPATKPPVSSYQQDAGVVQQAQEQALEKAQAMEERAADPKAKSMVQAVEEEMEKALNHLATATNSPVSLPAASSSEQAAYQALLRLSAHEFQVSQSQKGGEKGNQSAGQQPSQSQLAQLDLKPAENRYETQSQAAPQQTPEQREQLQVLSRLKELAQRQQDLNSRLKELQTALQEAKSEQEREDIRRRLKRLREEEQQMLSDIDELRQRMEQPENQSRMAEARQQLEQTRSKVQQATEALDKESAPDALASGTRAERELEQLRDDFRKKNSNQFTDEMRQMRSDARDLAQKQEEIGKKLDSLADTKKKTLSDSDETKALAQQLQQQKGGMTNLLENMRRVSEQAEPAEPLLSKQLYDTLRKATQDEARSVKDATDDLVREGMLSRSLYDKLQNLKEAKGGQSLDVASELLQQKMVPQAGQAEQRARQGIDDVKKGVEHAAESILGDDTESLRQAKRALDDLTRQLDDEIAQAAAAAARQQASTNRGAQSAQAQSASPQGQKGQQQASSQGAQSANQPGNEPGQTASAQQQGSQGKDSQGAQGSQGQSPSDQNKGEQGSPQQTANSQGNQPGSQPGQAPGKQDGQGQPGNQPSNQPGTQPGDQAGNQPGRQPGAQPSNQPGGQPGNQPGSQPGQQPGNQPGNQPGDQAGNQPGNQPGQPNPQNQPGKGQGGGPGQPGQPGDPQQQAAVDNQPQQPGQNQPGEAKDGQRPGTVPRPGSGRQGLQKLFNLQAAGNSGEEQGDTPKADGPLTGENFSNWSDKLRDVEEMIDLPDVRNEVARVRGRARAVRLDLKQNLKKPDWAVVKLQISQPLAEVRNRISEELARRQSPDALVPIDRDPVPNKFSDLVRQYYEKLGGSE